MRLMVSLGQMDVRLGEPIQNMAQVTTMTAEAARRGSDVVVFPELWSTGGDLENAARYAAPIDQGVFAETAALAQRHQIYILGSCLSLLGEGRFGNTAVLFAPDGRALADYSKTHLFRLMSEEKYLTAGDKLATAATDWGTWGLAICYDLRFPELFRRYALMGANLVFLPSAWPHPRLAHWRALLRARAIENQMFMAACNQVGETAGNHFFGHSTIVDPWGEIVLELGEQEMLATAVLDLSLVDKVRAKIPVFADRRTDLYG